MMGYFSNASTPDELKARYRDLSKRYHPDKEGGSLEKMQEINAEYDAVVRGRYGQSVPEFDGDLYDYLSKLFDMDDDAFVAMFRKNSGKILTGMAFGFLTWLIIRK